MSADTSFLIQGPSGTLEVAVSLPHASSSDLLCVICHPHPLHDGSMNNKVVYTLMRAAKELGAIVVRFNFRGVGKSTGQFDKGVGEVDDLLAVMAWAKAQYNTKRLWLAGFSFGAFVVTKAYGAVAQQQTIEKLLLVAPPVTHFDCGDTDFALPVAVIMGDHDDVILPEAVAHWAASQRNTTMYWLHGAGHFFHGQLSELKDNAQHFWQT